jgi:hypothetical protein
MLSPWRAEVAAAAPLAAAEAAAAERRPKEN